MCRLLTAAAVVLGHGSALATETAAAGATGGLPTRANAAGTGSKLPVAPGGLSPSADTADSASEQDPRGMDPAARVTPTTPPNAALALNQLDDPPAPDGASNLRTAGLAGEDIPIKTGAAGFIRRSRAARTETAGLPWYRGGVVSLLAVLGVIAAATLLVKRFVKSTHVVRGDVVQVLCRTHLSPKHSIALVQMGGRLAFVGITPESINTLRSIDDEEEVALLHGKLRAGGHQSERDKFDKLLSREGQRFGADLEPVADMSPASAEQIIRTRQDLKGLLDSLRSYRGA